MPKRKKRAGRRRSSRKHHRRTKTLRGKAKRAYQKTKGSVKRGVRRVRRKL